MKQRIHTQKFLNWHKPQQEGDWKPAGLRPRSDSPRGGRDWLGKVRERQDGCVYCGDLDCADPGVSSLRCVWRSNNRRDDNVAGADDGWLESYEIATDYLLIGSERSVFGRLAFSNQIPLPVALVDEARLVVLQGGEGKRISEEELARFFTGLIYPGSEKEKGGDPGPQDLEDVRRVLLPGSGGCAGEAMKVKERDYLTRLMALFSGYRTRGLSAWRMSSDSPRKELASLARHLFCQHPVPGWLDAVWGGAESVQIVEIQRSLKWACWYVCLGGGGSLRKLARLMGVRMTDRTVAHLYEAPAHLMPELACMWAEAVALGGKKRVADWLVKHQGYHIDPTVFPRGKKDAQFARFWVRTVQWFARYEDELTDEQAAELLEWGWFKFDHSLRAGGTSFSWSGRTPRKCLEDAPGFLQNALRALGGETNKRWEAALVGWEHAETDSEGSSQVWRFEELTQSSDLWEEGVAMRHCVAKYDSKCNDGGTVMVSLRRNGARALTIELRGDSLVLGQVKGRFNRPATEEELRVVQRWLNEVVRSRTRSRCR